MYFRLNSLKGHSTGIITGYIKGDTRNLDYSSYDRAHFPTEFLGLHLRLLGFHAQLSFQFAV